MPGEGGDQRSGDEPREEDQADGALAADAVRVDRDGDQVRVVPDDRSRPGELERAEIRVPTYGGERGERVPEPRADPLPVAGASHRRLPNERVRGKISATLAGLVVRNRAFERPNRRSDHMSDEQPPRGRGRGRGRGSRTVYGRAIHGRARRSRKLRRRAGRRGHAPFTDAPFTDAPVTDAPVTD